MYNIRVHFRDQNSSNALRYMSTQSGQCFSGNLHQFIWMQPFFLNTTMLQKYFKGNNHCRMGHYYYPANIYLFKVSNRNTRKKCKICSQLILNTPERRQ